MRNMTQNTLAMCAAAGSAALLVAAFTFQFFGYPPCALCLLQRWPHAVAIVIGVIAILIPSRIWPWLGALSADATSIIGAYHAGVEYRWWQGPSSCTGGGGSDLGSLAGDLLSTVGPRLVMCDQPTMVGPLSMAGWNAVLSAGLFVVWIMAARRREAPVE